MNIYIKECSAEGCTNKAQGRGLCWKHYQRWRRKRDISDPIYNVDKVCKVEGCNEPVRANDLCIKHGYRQKANGDVHTVKRIKSYSEDDVCIVPGCEIKVKSNRMCNKHTTNYHYHKNLEHVIDVAGYLEYLAVEAPQQETAVTDEISVPIEMEESKEETKYKEVNGDMYSCYLNGRYYGTGPAKYMTELFKDYIEVMEMYGRDECNFTIQRREISMEL